MSSNLKCSMGGRSKSISAETAPFSSGTLRQNGGEINFQSEIERSLMSPLNVKRLGEFARVDQRAKQAGV